MRFEDMKNEIPETPEFIHTMIQNEVEKQMQATKVVDVRRRKRWTAPKVAVVAAACVAVTASVVYAGVNIYHMFLEKQGTYGVTTGIKGGDGTEETTVPKTLHEVDIFARYIPDGMEWIDDFHLEYPEHDRNGGFSFASSIFDPAALDQVVQEQNVVDSEQRTFGDYEGVYLKYNSLSEGTFDQRIYLLCPDLYRIFTIYIGDDVSKEDAVKVAENLVLTENDTVIDTAGLGTWEEKGKEEEVVEEALTVAEDQDLPVHQIGDSFRLDVTGEDENGEYLAETISARVDSVQITDDLALLDPGKIPEKWVDAIGADGKLQTDERSYVKSGDGVNTLDEIVRSEEVPQKLVYATVTYTNDTDKKIHHMLYMGSLFTMRKENGTYEIYDAREQAGTDYDRIIQKGVASVGEMKYFSLSEQYENGRNYISVIKPGESVQLQMAWIVDEVDLENMYLNINGDGASSEFSEGMQKNGVVDIYK